MEALQFLLELEGESPEWCARLEGEGEAVAVLSLDDRCLPGAKQNNAVLPREATYRYDLTVIIDT